MGELRRRLVYFAAGDASLAVLYWNFVVLYELQRGGAFGVVVDGRRLCEAETRLNAEMKLYAV